jgi:hypothetical protein
MINHWQNTAVVAALMGAIDATLLLTGISTSEAFQTSEELPTEENALMIARAYYVLWAFSGISNLSCVLLNLILSVHFKDLMLGDDDKIWFILTWYIQSIDTKSLIQLKKHLFFKQYAI